MKSIYLDYAAATPVRKEVLLAMEGYFYPLFANPGSVHPAGKRAKEAVELARKNVASILGTEDSSEIIFTGSGTESINLALQGIARAYRKKGNHIITTKIEHKAVLETCRFLEESGQCTVTYLDVDNYGRVNPRDVEKAITKKTILISVMYANNEIGTIQQLADIGEIACQKKILFHTDACQAAGALDLSVKTLNVDLLTLNGSKMYGPKGVGMLYVRKGVTLVPLIFGGGQEFGLRGGTENVPGIVGFSRALELAENERSQESQRLMHLRDQFIEKVQRVIPRCKLNGHPIQRLPNNVNISFAGIDAETLLKALGEQGIYVSAGSACTANSITLSHVLEALHVSKALARGTLRFTFGKGTNEKDLGMVLKVLKETVEILRDL